jgi:hypothetical protein
MKRNTRTHGDDGGVEAATDGAGGDGERVDLTATFLSRRRLETDHGAVERLLVSTPAADEPRVVLLPERIRGRALGLLTGRRYRLSDGVVCRPPAALDAPADESRCRACGGRRRRAGAIDRFPPAVGAAAATVETDAALVVADERTDLSRADEPAPRRTRAGPGAPDGTVCRDCGRRTEN